MFTEMKREDNKISTTATFENTGLKTEKIKTFLIRNN